MTQRNYAYYPGCSLQVVASDYDRSTRLVWERLGIGLHELSDWTCCGASSAHGTSKLLGLALPARNLQLAESEGLPLTTPCPACFSRLKFASYELTDVTRRSAVSEVLGREFHNSVTILPILAAVAPEEIAAAVRRPINGLRIACYYGCMFVRPAKVMAFDDEENPQSMDRLLMAAGAETIDWALKTECCGASLAIPHSEIVVRLTARILRAAKHLGADCIAVACPLCQSNLDQRQREIGRELGEAVDMPILYFSQLLGLALGYTSSEMMIDRSLTDARPLLRAKGIG